MTSVALHCIAHSDNIVFLFSRTTKRCYRKMRHFIPSYDIFSHIVASACSHGSIIYSDIGKKRFSFYLLSFFTDTCIFPEHFSLFVTTFNAFKDKYVVDLNKHVETPKLWF